MEDNNHDRTESDSWDQSPDLLSEHELEAQGSQRKMAGDKKVLQIGTADPTFSKVDPDYHFCYRLSCKALLSSRKKESATVRLRVEDPDQLRQPPLELHELHTAFPRRCQLYLNVFRHNRTPAPTGVDPNEWKSVPVVFGAFDHHGGDLRLKISGCVCVNSQVIAAVARPGDEKWAVFNQTLLIEAQRMLETSWNLVVLRFRDKSRDPLHFYLVDRQSFAIKEGYKDCRNSRVVPTTVKVVDKAVGADGGPECDEAGKAKKSPTIVSGESELQLEEELLVNSPSKAGRPDKMKKVGIDFQPRLVEPEPEQTLEKSDGEDKQCVKKAELECRPKSRSSASSDSKTGHSCGSHEGKVTQKLGDGVWIEHTMVLQDYLELKLRLPSSACAPKQSINLDMTADTLRLECSFAPYSEEAPLSFSTSLLTRCNADLAKATYCSADKSITIRAPVVELRQTGGSMDSLD